jgi:hypothetical protein
MIATARLAGVILAVLLTGCAGPPKEPPGQAANHSGPLTIDPSLAGTKRESAVVTETAPPAVPANAAPAAAAAPTRTESSAIATPPPDKAAAKPAVAPAVVEKQPAKPEPPAVVKKAEPTLDMTALTARLRDTKSIGVFTKLALKGQVDDLLKQFRAYYQNSRDISIAALRQNYDMLVLKVLALVQDNDPPLAREIAGSREALWGMLADRQKFSTIN